MSEDTSHRARNSDFQGGSSAQPTQENVTNDKQHHGKNLSHSASATDGNDKTTKAYKQKIKVDSDSENDNAIPMIMSRNRYSSTIVPKSSSNNNNSNNNNNNNSNKKENQQQQSQSTNSTKRNRSVNSHPKRSANIEAVILSKDTDLNNTINDAPNSNKKSSNKDNNNNYREISETDHSNSGNKNSNNNNNNNKRADSVRRHQYNKSSSSNKNSNNNNEVDSPEHHFHTKSGSKRISLQTANPIIIEHFFIEERPQPFTGTLVSKINGRSMKNLLKQDEVLQFVPQMIIPGPTFRQSSSSSSLDFSISSKNSQHNQNQNQASKQQSQNLGQSEKPRARSVSQKTDVLITNLFVDDDPITYFDFDFATTYTAEHDEVIDDEFCALNYFPSIEQIEANKVNFNEDSEVVISKLKDFFYSETQPQEYLSLTKTVSPYKNDVVLANVILSNNNINTNTNNNNNSIANNGKRVNVRQIEIISSTSFFEFRFGSEITEFAPDRVHIFTWHNMGIPASQIAKNLLYFFNSLRDAANIKTPIRAIAQYILLWIKYFPKDFDEESSCADLILTLLKSMAGKSKASICFINVVGSLVVDLHNKTIKPEDVNLSLKKPAFKEIARVNYLINLSLDPYILAQHFAYIDLCLLHSLQRTEFVHNNWSEERRKRDNSAPCFNQVMSRFNETVAFIAASILIETEKRRARNISYWIKMMYYARRVHNYHLLAIIDAGLSCFPVKRLKNSWKLVNDNALIAFSRLHNFFKKLENQREMLSEPKKTIPFIGIFLSQLSQIDIESTKTTLKTGTSAYNLDVQRKCFNIIDQIFYPWGVEIEFELDEKLLKECKLLSGKARQPKDLVIPSISFEPVRNDEKEILSEYLTRP